MDLGRRSNHCCKTMEGRSSCSKINSLMEHVRHLLSRGNFMLMITRDYKDSSVTSRNLPKCEREVAFRTFSAGWSFTGLYSPPCLFWILSHSSPPGRFFPSRCIPNTKLQALHSSAGGFFDIGAFTAFNKSWFGMRKTLLPP